MAHAEATARVAADPDTLWREIGTFQGVGGWHPMPERVEGDGEQPGALRTAHTADGAQQVERLQEVGERRHTYTMESSPLPVGDYTAELRVDADGAGSVVTWSADFAVTEGAEADAVALVEGFLQAGVEALADRYGGP